MCRLRSPSEIEEIENLILILDAYLEKPTAANHMNLYKMRQRLREEEEKEEVKSEKEKVKSEGDYHASQF